MAPISPPISPAKRGDSSRRMASPSPSIRLISNRRVNQERSPLLERRHDNNEYGFNSPHHVPAHIPSYLQNELHFPKSSSDVSDVESFVYQPQPEPMSTTSLEQRLDGQYIPTNIQKLENLAWNDILPYYLPFMSWIGKYNFQFLIGDLIGGLTLVFFQLPLSLSYATTLAHVPVVSGLYSLGISPIIYMIFGSVPQMIVGPEAPISLIVGQAVEPLLHHSKKQIDPLEYVSVITLLSGATLLGFGLGRFGFLDNVLSPSLLKGFIGSVGIVMNINALINCLGLEELMKRVSSDPEQMDIHSPFDKVRFLVQNLNKSNGLSGCISLIGWSIIMSIRIFKKYHGHNSKPGSKNIVAYIPEILIVVVGSTILCEYFRWDLHHIEVIGKVKHDGELQIYNPFSNWKLIKQFSTSGFLCAMLGFFESTTASKSLGTMFDLPISSNRELIALGSLNIMGSIFGGLPAFGGYGRSKVNAMSAKTTMSGGIMGLFTLITVVYLLDYLYFVPVCMLSVVSSVIGISLIEEAPYELYFHWISKGYNELITFTLTVLITLFFSMEGGIAVGLIYSLIRVIKNSTESRIQILGRYPDTNIFVDADIPTYSEMTVEHKSSINIFNDFHQTQLNQQVIEEIEGCLIIKIPEPLTFTNSSDLQSRLKRVEMYGSTRAHPASKRSRDESMTKYMIFDLNGMTEIDSSAAKILQELISRYHNRNIKTIFVRVANYPKVRQRLIDSGITNLLYQDLIDLRYFIMQNIALKYINSRGRNLEPQEEVGSNSSEIETVLSCFDLIESEEEPYFKHIRDSLKVIDCFEVSRSLLDRDV
ncbi:putative sulfate transporter [Spathaspora sp. JA1]|nr:putative sulfate transporter [Spathaspora sp. JA1]